MGRNNKIYPCAFDIRFHRPYRTRIDCSLNCARQSKFRRQTCHQCMHDAHRIPFERWHLWMGCHGIACVRTIDDNFHLQSLAYDVHTVPRVFGFELFGSEKIRFNIKFIANDDSDPIRSKHSLWLCCIDWNSRPIGHYHGVLWLWLASLPQQPRILYHLEVNQLAMCQDLSVDLILLISLRNKYCYESFFCKQRNGVCISKNISYTRCCTNGSNSLQNLMTEAISRYSNLFQVLMAHFRKDFQCNLLTIE